MKKMNLVWLGLFLALLAVMSTACNPVAPGQIYVKPNPDYLVPNKPNNNVKFDAKDRILVGSDVPSGDKGYVLAATANIPAGFIGLLDNGKTILAGSHPDIANDEVIALLSPEPLVWSTMAVENLDKCNRWQCETSVVGPSKDYIAVSYDLDITFHFNTPEDTTGWEFFKKYPTEAALKNLVVLNIGVPARDKSLPSNYEFDSLYLNKDATWTTMNTYLKTKIEKYLKARSIPITIIDVNIRQIEPADAAILAAKNKLGLKLASQAVESAYYAARTKDIRAVLDELKDQPWQVKVQSMRVIFGVDEVTAVQYVTQTEVPQPEITPVTP